MTDYLHHQRVIIAAPFMDFDCVWGVSVTLSANGDMERTLGDTGHWTR